MRQQYTPIFRSILHSRLWSFDAATIRVWLWLQLSADPEGYVPVHGLAGVSTAAHVTLEQARLALATLAAGDPDDPDDPHQGRLIEAVGGGWLVLGFEETRDLAKHESRKARQRTYMKALRRSRAAQNDVSEPDALPVSPPKPKPKPISVEATETPLPPAAPVSVSITQLPDDWQPSDELRVEAKLAGVRNLDQRIAQLRTGPIGGSRGVLQHKLDAYIRGMFRKWKLWDETDAAKAPPEPDQAQRITGFPQWVHPLHAEYCKENSLDLKQAAKRFAKTHHIPPDNLALPAARQAFGSFLEKLRKEAA